ncbi:hypothetical protein, partial [Flammeovirga sp. OC4]|uniref:hypothetical protein n=1 Tax=Flammeovirga sp. OC4 TaxID=1382345 RepID=UPI0005C46596
FDTNVSTNTYQWFKDNTPIEGEISRELTTNITGEYHCEIKNSKFIDLTINTEKYIVFDQIQLAQDSTVVAQISKDNPQSSLNWNLDDPISTWEGVSINNYRVTALKLANKNINLINDNISNLDKIDSLILSKNNISSLPESISNINSIKVLMIDNNNITLLPANLKLWSDLRKITLQNNSINQIPDEAKFWSNLDTIKLENNKLTFKDLKVIPNATSYFTYSPQDSISNAIELFSNRKQLLSIDENIDTGIENISFEWYFDNNIIPDQNDSTYIASVTGKYNYTYKSPDFPELTLFSKSINIFPANSFDILDSLALVDIYNSNPNNTLNWNLEQSV